MTETPLHDNIKSYMEPLIKSSERIGSARALLMVAQWIKDEIDAGNIRPSKDIKHIMDGMDKIRTDILLDKAKRG
jgi:3-oxoacyl-ACP reductase-like protein